MAKKIRLFDVEEIQFAWLKSDPPKLSVSVTGNATTAGWSDAELVPLEKTLSADGILDLEFVANPPKGRVPQVLTRMSANTVWESDVERLVGVNIHVRTGEVLRMLGEQSQEFAGSFEAGFDGGSGFTTMAVGEEGPGPGPTTMALGEEGPRPGPTTLAVGEEGPRPGPTTLAVGEEGPRPTTFALGEESPGGSTLRLGEEGPIPSTRRLGEEGPFPITLRWPGEEGPKTIHWGEEGPKSFWPGEEGPKTAPIMEEGPKPWFGETDPRGETSTGLIGEDLDFGEFDDFDPFGRR